MTTFAWPADWDVEDFKLQLRGNFIEYPNPTSKEVAVIDQLGEYWAGTLSLPRDVAPEQGHAQEVFFDRLLGRVHRVALYNLKRPIPRGTARGAMVLGATAAALAGSLTVDGCINRNLLSYGSFEIDSNADGLADGWSRYTAGSVGTLSAAQSAGVVAHGSWGQFLGASTLGATSGDRQGIFRSGTSVVNAAGAPASATCVVVGSLNSSIQLDVAWRDAGGTVIGSMTTGAVVLTTGFQTLAVTGTVPVGAVTCIVYLYQHSNTGGAPGFYCDALQLESGGTPTDFAGFPTLLQGDMLGVGTQLFRVQDDATANDAGRIVVNVGPRVRTAWASGSSVTWYRPTVPVLLMADDVGTLWRGGAGFDGLQGIPFVEA